MNHRSILIADIVSSTELYEKLGNVAAKELVAARLHSLVEKVEVEGGRLIKSMGDGILCDFEQAEQAVMAAASMCINRGSSPATELAIRIGLHCGEVVEDDGDIFGDAVNTAARIASIAKPSEILISKDLVSALPPYLRSLARMVKPVSVKGKKEQLQLFAIHNDDSSQTMAATSRYSEETNPSSLELSFESSTYRLGGDQPGLTLGRDRENSMVIKGEFVSRLHARIYNRHGKFLFVDQSANGSYLVPEGQSTIHLHREEALLNGTGSIFLGANPDNDETVPVRYRVTP